MQQLVTFAAAIVLLAYSKIGEYRPEADVSDMGTAWTRCLSILQYYEDQIPSANHAIRILHSMKNQVLETARIQGRSSSYNPQVFIIADSSKVQANNQGQSLPPYHTPGSANGNGAISTPLNLNLEDGDFFGAENLTEAWYGQQLINLDWLDFPQQQFAPPVQPY